MTTSNTTQQKPLSILQRRWRKFKSLRRGYYSFILLSILYVVSFALPLLVNNKAVIVSYEGAWYFPALSGTFYSGEAFGVSGIKSEVNYRELDSLYEQSGNGNWVLMPLYSWNPYESDYDNVLKAPSATHLFGTDNTGRDVFARLCYGFNVSISFALILTILIDVLGVSIGAIMGYYGGKFDLFFQRFIEIWQTIPSLFVIIIISSIIFPNFFTLAGLLVLFGWMGMTYFLRGEVYREKAKDYVSAAIALGATDNNIIFKHILPNSLTPIISGFPFAIIGGISSLVGLDYLGYGLPPPTPSWGQMVSVGLNEFSGSFQNWWLVLTPLSAMFLTLILVTFIGEAIREAFDPKEYSRLR
ncbi:MAG: ABC transporter permease subunit [Chlorobi bacterium]|nr:MAG: peptide/nickel transport system permease protein [Chlorobi bacterium OLB7]MBK8910763.1 ABC transporter permease subunit [Chlorobiota bacterium]MBX7217326.1 ABC transporter permease subunit [Candidatus Kapabacteria bacterium]